jgi:hypothetical protein
MSQSEMFALLSSDEMMFDHDDLVGGFRKSFGFEPAGEWNSDPQFDEYEETIELAEALATMEW